MRKKNRKIIPKNRHPTPLTTAAGVRIVNTGYSESGASLRKGSLKGWNPVRSSAKSDIDANASTLRGRSAGLFMGSPIARGAINTSRTNVIGAGLNLSAKCKFNILGISAAEAKAWNKKTMEEFDLWASSVHCDLYKKNNFYDMQDIIYTAYLIDGDSFALFNYRKSTPLNPYALRVQIFEASRVSNPNSSVSLYASNPFSIMARNPENANRIINGVEIDQDGAVVAYWVSSRVPFDLTEANDLLKWQRVEAFGQRTGKPNILQICHDERPEQYRGAPYLAPVIEVLKQVSRYSEAELTSAVVKSFFSLFFIEGSAGGMGFNGAINEAYDDDEKVSINPRDYELGAGTINILPPGYDVKTADASRTLSTFEPFTNQLIKQVGAAIEQPYEVLMKAFQSSYSASRAALLQAWAAFKIRRTWFARDFCQPVYETWLTEAIALGRIDAPGFFTDPLIRKAWCNAEWYGPVMGVLDPVKEAQGANLRIKSGYSTHEKETAEMTGTNWEDNIEQLELELATMRQKNINMNGDNKAGIKGGGV